MESPKRILIIEDVSAHLSECQRHLNAIGLETIGEVNYARFHGSIEDPTLEEFDLLIDLRDDKNGSEKTNQLDSLGPVSPKTQRKPIRIPGGRIRSVTKFIFPRKVFEENLEELFNDLWNEYIDAIAADEKRHARWIVVRGHIIFFKTVAVFLLSCTLGKLLREVFSFSPDN